MDTEQDTGPDIVTDTAQACEATGPLVVDLNQFPALRNVNGSAIVNFPDQFVQLVIACVAAEEWSAVWRICSHGVCDLEWTPTESHWECPCHGSIFNIDGEVQTGPATKDQAGFDVCREGDFLSIERRN